MERRGGLKDYGGGFLLLCLFAAMAFAYMVLRPFLTICLMALVLSVIARPVYKWILTRTGNREALSSVLTVLLIIVLVLIPCLVLLSLLTNEGIQAYEWVNTKVKMVLEDGVYLEKIKALQERFLPKMNFDLAEMAKSLAGTAGQVSNLVINMAKAALGALTNSLWKTALMLFALFYFLIDGPRFLKWAQHLIPLPSSLENEIGKAFVDVSRSAFYGTFLTAVCQGILGGLGFWIAGLQPLVWGVVMGFFSLIPVVGTALVWFPAAVILMLTNNVGWGIFLIIWGIVVVGMSDNVLRPLFMRGESQLHPLLIFFSLIGGIAAFGLLGILLGPLAIVILLSFLKAYAEAARPVLVEMDNK